MNEQGKRDTLLYGAAFVIICLMFTIFYTKHLVSESERRDCGNLRSDIYAYLAVPPATPTGWGQLNSKAARYKEIGCSPTLGSVPSQPAPPRTQPSR